VLYIEYLSFKYLHSQVMCYWL